MAANLWHRSYNRDDQGHHPRRRKDLPLHRPITYHPPKAADLCPFKHPQWKVLVLDESSKKIIDNVVKEDDILNQNIASNAPAPVRPPCLACVWLVLSPC